MKGLRILTAVLALTLSAVIVSAAEKITIFAAASTTDMLNEVIEMYNKQGGEVVASYASSGVLARQIEAGAPANLFVSANQEWMDYIEERELVAANSRKDWLGNILVLIGQKDGKITYKIEKGALLSKVIGNEKLAIGDPDHVPAGAYAKEAMENLGLWEDIEANLVRADNVRVVLMLVSRGEAPLGVVFGSDYVAAADSVKIIDTFPADSFAPISYPMGLIKGNDTAEAKKFYDFLQSTAVKDIVNKHGFELLP